MLSTNSILVLSYLKRYFYKNSKPITIFDINIEELSLAEVETSFCELEEMNLIKLNKQYIHPCVEKVINLKKYLRY